MRIDSVLSEIEAAECVRILWAIESGSRAWGFPSPDSDWDVRFVYVRPRDWYLSLVEGRDVIERQVGDLDVVGWDARKALRLATRPNPQLVEWLSSPIVYRESEFCWDLREIVDAGPHRRACLHHYMGLLQRDYRERMGDDALVRIKTYCYAMRAALALRWLLDGDKGLVPMRAQDLATGRGVSFEVAADFNTMVYEKSDKGEDGMTHRRKVLDEFIEATEAGARRLADGLERPAYRNDMKAANDLFLRLVA